MIWNQLYNAKSAKDKGTLTQLQNVIYRSNVPTTVKNNFSAAQDFFDLVLEAHVTAAALEFFGMSSVDNLPTNHVFPPNHDALSASNRKQYFHDTVGTFVDEFIFHYVDTVKSLSQEMQNPTLEREDNSPSRDDGIFNYARAVLSNGLLALDLHDASRHGDRRRMYRCWKFLLLHFKADNRTKYALEAFHLIAQVEALLMPRLAHELPWNHVCNPHGGVGRNIPLDLEEEYLNRLFKDDINTFRAHITDTSVSRSANLIGPMQELLKHLDQLLEFHDVSGKHSQPETKEDFKAILKILTANNVFHQVPGRCHSAYKSMPANPLVVLMKHPEKLRKWLIAKRKHFGIQQEIDKGL